MQREDVLGATLQLLEIQGIASTSLEMVAERVNYPLDELRRFWPDKEALLYDALRYLSQQVDTWRRQLMLNTELSAEQSSWRAIPRSPNACVITAIRAVCLLPPAPFTRIPATRSTSWPISKNAPHMTLRMSC